MKLRAAVIGVGNMGYQHARIYASMDTVSLLAVCSLNQPTVENVAHDFNVRGYLSHQALLANEELDLVSIATPAQSHFEVTRDVIHAGVHGLVEKPFTRTIHEAELLIAEASQRSAILMVGYIERFNPAIVELRRRISQGEAGRITELVARRLHPPAPRTYDAGVTLDLAVHDIDVARYLLAAEVEEVATESMVFADSGQEIAVSARLRFSNGARMHLEVNREASVKQRWLKVVGERATYEVNYITQELTIYKGSSRYSVPIQKAEPLAMELEEFVSAVKAGSCPPVTSHDGLIGVTIAHEIMKAGKGL